MTEPEAHLLAPWARAPMLALSVSLALLGLAACHGQFRFDETVTVVDVDAAIYPPPDPDAAPVPDSAPDAPPPPDVSPDRAAPVSLPDAPVERPRPADGPDCFVGLCGWQQEEGTCTASRCDLECEDDPVCSGSCGSQCSAECKESTRCSLTTAGAGADLECRERSTCSFVLGAAGQIRCREDASCTVRCLGSCALDCEDATCRLQCAADSAPRSVTGTVRCP